MSNNYYPTPRSELLPSFRRTPLPEVLLAQMQQTLNDMRVNPTWQPPYQPVQYKTSQGTMQTPPPELLRTQALDIWNQNAQPLINEYGADIGLNLMLTGAGLGTPRILGTALKIPKVQAGINAGVNALEGTKYGRPFVTKLRQAAENPYVQKATGLLDAIF